MHYHMRFDSKLVHATCTIRQIPCAYVECTYVLEKPWVHGSPPQQQTSYQPVTDFTYWSVLGSFNNWNIITFPQKDTTGEDFE